MKESLGCFSSSAQMNALGLYFERLNSLPTEKRLPEIHLTLKVTIAERTGQAKGQRIGMVLCYQGLPALHSHV